MVTADRLEVALSKSKMLLMLGGCAAFIAIGAGLTTVDQALDFLPRALSSPRVVNLVGIVAIAFFGLAGVLIARKLFDRRPGLVIDSQGITDRSSALAAGFIPWSDVAEVRDYQIQGQPMAVIVLHDAEKYIARGNALAQSVRRANYKLCGSPVSIAAASLEIGHEALLRELQQRQRRAT